MFQEGEKNSSSNLSSDKLYRTMEQVIFKHWTGNPEFSEEEKLDYAKIMGLFSTTSRAANGLVYKAYGPAMAEQKEILRQKEIEKRVKQTLQDTLKSGFDPSEKQTLSQAVSELSREDCLDLELLLTSELRNPIETYSWRIEPTLVKNFLELWLASEQLKRMDAADQPRHVESEVDAADHPRDAEQTVAVADESQSLERGSNAKRCDVLLATKNLRELAKLSELISAYILWRQLLNLSTFNPLSQEEKTEIQNLLIQQETILEKSFLSCIKIFGENFCLQTRMLSGEMMPTLAEHTKEKMQTLRGRFLEKQTFQALALTWNLFLFQPNHYSPLTSDAFLSNLGIDLFNNHFHLINTLEKLILVLEVLKSGLEKANFSNASQIITADKISGGHLNILLKKIQRDFALFVKSAPDLLKLLIAAPDFTHQAFIKLAGSFAINDSVLSGVLRYWDKLSEATQILCLQNLKTNFSSVETLAQFVAAIPMRYYLTIIERHEHLIQNDSEFEAFKKALQSEAEKNASLTQDLKTLITELQKNWDEVGKVRPLTLQEQLRLAEKEWDCSHSSPRFGK